MQLDQQCSFFNMPGAISSLIPRIAESADDAAIFAHFDPIDLL